jgi:hypothetical protein
MPSPDSAGILLWLVREDFSGTIDLREIRLDEEALAQIGVHGLRPVAVLARTLAGTTAGVMPISDVEEISIGGRRCFAFEQVTVASADTTRVVVLEAGGRVFTLSSLAVPGAGEEVRQAVAAAQEAFVEGMEW